MCPPSHLYAICRSLHLDIPALAEPGCTPGGSHVPLSCTPPASHHWQRDLWDDWHMPCMVPGTGIHISQQGRHGPVPKDPWGVASGLTMLTRVDVKSDPICQPLPPPKQQDSRDNGSLFQLCSLRTDTLLNKTKVKVKKTPVSGRR